MTITPNDAVKGTCITILCILTIPSLVMSAYAVSKLNSIPSLNSMSSDLTSPSVNSMSFDLTSPPFFSSESQNETFKTQLANPFVNNDACYLAAIDGYFCENTVVDTGGFDCTGLTADKGSCDLNGGYCEAMYCHKTFEATLNEDGFQCAKKNLKFYQCYEKFCVGNGEGCDKKAASCASELQIGIDTYLMLGDDTTGACRINDVNTGWKEAKKKGQFSCYRTKTDSNLTQ